MAAVAVGEYGPNTAVANELAQQLGVLRLMQIVKQRQQTSLVLLGAIFRKESEIGERNVVGDTLPDIMHTLQSFTKIFILERESFKGATQEIRVRLTDQANADSLILLSGVLKLKNILKKKERLNIKQLSTFYNQKSSMEEKKLVGRNPATLKQTIQALPSIFSISGDFITIKVENPPESSSDEISSNINHDSSDGESQAGSQIYSADAPISYASAVTVHTVKDDENSRAHRSGLSKLRNHLAEFGTSSIPQLFNLLVSRGTKTERHTIGENLESLEATLKGLPNIFAVSDQFVDLVGQPHRANGLAKIYQFLKTKGSCEVVQISGFVGQQGIREEREALGKNPQSLCDTLKKFPCIFTLNEGRFSLNRHPQLNADPNNMTVDEYGGITTSLSPAFLIKSRTRNESIGIDSGYEGSVTFDQPDREGAAGDADVHLQPTKVFNTTSSAALPQNHDEGQPEFTMIDITSNNDARFKNFKRECHLSLNEYDKQIIGISMSDDHMSWLAISSWADNVYLVDLEACAADGSGDHGASVINILRDVLQSAEVLKIVYDCRMVAAALYRRFGFKLVNVFDTMRAHQILTCDDFTSVDELCGKYGGVTPPSKWCATIGEVGWTIIDSGGSTSDIGLAACARVLVPHLYQQMVVKFTTVRVREVQRLCEQDVQGSYF